MFEEIELINLILGLVALVIVYYETRKRLIPRFHLFLAAFYLIIMARIFTVAEAFVLPVMLNILEHGCYTASAFFFAAGCISLTLNSNAKAER